MIFLLDHDQDRSSFLVKQFSASGQACRTFASFLELQQALLAEQPALLLVYVGAEASLISLDQLKALLNAIPGLRMMALLESDSYVQRSRWLRDGCDAVLSRPFAMEELLAWSSALMRRVPGCAPMDTGLLQFADLSLDLVRRRAERAGVPIKLTVKEFDLLAYFMRQPETVLPRLQILHAVWGDNWSGDDNLLDVYIRYLRKKLAQPGSPELIQTVRGIGYVLRQDEPQAYV